MKILYCVLAILLCASAALCEVDARTAALDTKPELDKPITLTLRAASIREILEKVQTETGVRLRPDREIAEDKATIVVKDKPARDVLRALAHCFNLSWTESEVGSSRFLTLLMDRESDIAMRQRQWDDYQAVLKQYDTELQATAVFLRADAKYTTPPYAQGQNLDEYWRLGQREAATQSSSSGALVLQFLNLSESERKDLFGGKEESFTGGSIAEEAKKHYPEATSFRLWIEPSLNGYILQGTAEPEMQPNDLTILTMALFDDSRHDKAVQAANEILLKDAALAKDLPAPKPEDKITVAPSPQLDAFSSSPMSVPKPGEGSGATPATMSDGLIPIAEALGVPIVAQYISEYQQTIAKPLPKAGERLAQLCTLHKFTIERDGDFLLAKYTLWHRLRDREVPEAAIRRWQQSSTGLPAPTFDVLAEMGSMSWGQVRGIINNSRYWLGIPDVSQIARSEYSLALYASLNPTQQRALGEEAKIAVSSLKPEQQTLFMQAFETKTRPTYALAQDRSWPQTATFFLVDQGFGGISLLAMAQTRTLGSDDNLLNSIPQDMKDQLSNMSPQQMFEFQLSHRKEAEDVVATAAKKLLDKVSGEHPEIPRKNIGIYAQRACVFQLNLGEHSATNYLDYCAKVL